MNSIQIHIASIWIRSQSRTNCLALLQLLCWCFFDYEEWIKHVLAVLVHRLFIPACICLPLFNQRLRDFLETSNISIISDVERNVFNLVNAIILDHIYKFKIDNCMKWKVGHFLKFCLFRCSAYLLAEILSTL